LDKTATEEAFAKMIKTNFEEDIAYNKNTGLKLRTLIYTLNNLNDKKQAEIEASQQPEYAINSVSNFPILDDVYQKLKNNHYSSDSFRDETLIQGAIKGMAEATDDQFTTYFPPAEAKEFQEELDGEFQGI